MESTIEEQLQKALNIRFSEYQDTMFGDMKLFLNYFAQELQKKHESEQNSLQQELNSKEQANAKLQQQLEQISREKQQQRQYFKNSIQQHRNKEATLRCFVAWKSHHFWQNRKRRMTEKSMDQFNRITLRNCLKAWQKETHMIFKEHEQKVIQKVTEESKSKADQTYSSEIEMLKRMVVELTEDLRAETIAKNSLKYQFEQALLRGMSALNMESMTMEQGSIQRAQQMNEMSRSLLYTPERHGNLGFKTG